ncbi:hypothetical protein PAHAL_7G196800 [Panicum hallii]|uniref:Uncharacterized protein n=1 Tax=Panicum hallii TaxID=206008 RepID=A0A2T8ICT3_9POAL|nr:hypothetical protein PAHAL_7G196800 [Panicum hallii]
MPKDSGRAFFRDELVPRSRVSRASGTRSERTDSLRDRGVAGGGRAAVAAAQRTGGGGAAAEPRWMGAAATLAWQTGAEGLCGSGSLADRGRRMGSGRWQEASA